MAIRDLLPSRNRSDIPVRRNEYSSPFNTLRREMNRLFDEFFEDVTPAKFRDDLSYFPRVDVRESEKDIRVNAELPGMEAKDIDISISDDVLTVRGEKRQEHEEKDENYYRMERSYGSFHRDIALPDEVISDKVEAEFKNGVLTIRMPKKPESERKSKRIEIKG